MKQVSFGELTIREYPMVLGDHPNVSSGAPIQLGWKPQAEVTHNLELYEYCKAAEDDALTNKKASRIPVEKRGLILLQAGYTPEEIGRAAVQADFIKRRRAETAQTCEKADRGNVFSEMSSKIPQEMILGAMSLPMDILEATGRAINTRFVKPIRKTVQARTA